MVFKKKCGKKEKLWKNEGKNEKINHNTRKKNKKLR
jgi:hypothetical protein